MMEQEACVNLAEQYLEKTDFSEWSWRTMVKVFEPMFQMHGFREEPTDYQQHILLIRLDAMGDMVLSTGFVREVRRNNPMAYITLVVSPVIYPLVYKCPYVNEVLVIDAKLFDDGDKKEFFTELLHLCAEKLWTERYDISICPQWGDDKTVSNLVAYMSGALRRVGFSVNFASVYGYKFFDNSFENSVMTDSYIIPAEITHEAERTLYLLELLGWKIDNKKMEIWYGKYEKMVARNLLSTVIQSSRKVIAVGLGAGWVNRKYPVKQYAEACNMLSKKYDVYFVILGGKGEQQDALELQSLLPEGTSCNLAGKTSILETAAVLSMSNLYMGNATGVMHMAAAVGIPVVMVSREKYDYDEKLAGALSENERFAPWDTNYVICYPDERLDECKNWMGYGGCKAPYRHCICSIKPTELVQAAEELLF